MVADDLREPKRTSRLTEVARTGLPDIINNVIAIFCIRDEISLVVVKLPIGAFAVQSKMLAVRPRITTEFDININDTIFNPLSA
jgi:hypothetical protein